MKGSVHAMIGVSVPATAVLTGQVGILAGITMAAVTAGAALLPDLDHPGATASRSLGPFLHHAAHRLSRAASHGIASPKDRNGFAWMTGQGRDPYHRTVTHTLLAAFLLSLAVCGLGYSSPITTGLLAVCSVQSLWPLLGGKALASFPVSALVAVGAAIYLDSYLLAVAVFTGLFSHLLADACTTAGVPALWPLKIHGRHWWRIRPLGSQVRSGSKREKGPAVAVALVCNLLMLLLLS